MNRKDCKGNKDNIKENGSEAGEKSPIGSDSGEEQFTPNLLNDLNKKIAQLTKVVYGLNIRGEDLEGQLRSSRENEEKTKKLNSELQTKINQFKTKIENELGKLNELEQQAQQAQMWKREFETLQRRIELEGGVEGGGVFMSHVLEDLETAKRRESALQFELDQAKHAISNLKGHHDFIMRERDGQQIMEREKIVLEWKARLNECESRYKNQLRHLNEELSQTKQDLKQLDTDSRSSAREPDEVNFQKQLKTLNTQYELDKKEWERSLQRKVEDWNEERRRLVEEKHVVVKRVHAKAEEKEKKVQDLSQEFQLKEEEYLKSIEDLNGSLEILQRLVDDKEEEYEVLLKSKVVEWKTEWNAAEEVLNEEIRKLKAENLKLQTDVTSLKFSMDNASLNLLTKIQKLEDELEDKSNEVDIKSKNFKVRLGMVENENRQYLQERTDLERLLEEERERFKTKIKNQEIVHEQTRQNLQARLEQTLEAEKSYKEVNKFLEEEVEAVRNSKDDITKQAKDTERELRERFENQVKETEYKVKQKIERIWLDKLKKSEEAATYDLQKFQESRKRRELSLRQEISVAQNATEETKSINEELEKKLKHVRQNEVKKMKKLEEMESLIEEMKKKEERILLQNLKEISDLERRYQSQVEDLSLKLSEKQKEINNLKQKNCSLQEKSQTFPVDNSLLISLDDLKKQLRTKENLVERLKVELEYSKSELDISKMKVQRLDEDLKKSKEAVSGLQERHRSETRDRLSSTSVQNNKIKELQEELEAEVRSRKELEKSLTNLESEREDELKIVQDALDEAAEEREMLINTFEKELESLNSKNIAREQQMLEDFEFKLREMEKDNKNKLDEKERQAEARLNTVRSAVESEMSESLTKLAEDRRIADEKLAEVGHLRSYEAEVIQLRGVTHEFQKALRASAREMENLKVRERLLEEEIRSLKSGSQSRQTTLPRPKNNNDEEETRQKIDKLKSDINAQWEDKLRNECSRLKKELVDLHAEEKHLAVETMKVQKEQQIQSMKKLWEKTQEEMMKEISSLKDKLTDKDAFYHKELDTLRTSSDREIWDLRMKIQSLSESTMEKQQQLEEKYCEELERFRIDYEERIKDLKAKLGECEAELNLNNVSNLEKEHSSQMHYLEEQHKLSMSRLREELEADKFQAVEDVRSILARNFESCETSMHQKFSECSAKIKNLQAEIESLNQTVFNRDLLIQNLRETLEKCSKSENTDSNPNSSQDFPNEMNSSQFSLVSSDSQDSKGSLEQFYVPEGQDGAGISENDGIEDSPKASGSGLLGKVFGGSWFSPSKAKDSGKKGSKKTQ